MTDAGDDARRPVCTPGLSPDQTESRSQGPASADRLERLYPAVYDELKQIAARQMRGERPDHTLGATGLVHEAYLRLFDQTRLAWRDRNHFFGIVGRLMRQILIDHARRRIADKRGGGVVVRTDAVHAVAGDERLEQLLVLDDALDRLSEVDERLSHIVELRFMVGLTEVEVAELLDVTPRTVQREWRKARAWLYAVLYPADGRSSRPPAGSGE